MKITNIEEVTIFEGNTDSEIVSFAQQIFAENEESDTKLLLQENRNAALEYITEYCPNLTIIK